MKRIFLITFLSIFIFKVYDRITSEPHTLYMESVYRQKMPVLTTLWVELRQLWRQRQYQLSESGILYGPGYGSSLFSFGVTGEYAHLSTYKENASYRVAQNTAFNIAFRLHKNMYMSLGFTEKSDIATTCLIQTWFLEVRILTFNKIFREKAGWMTFTSD